MRNTFSVIVISWFIIVNLPQVVPFLNRVEPNFLGIPFNLIWIWGWNLLISFYLVYCAVWVWKTPDLNVDMAREDVKRNGLEVE